MRAGILSLAIWATLALSDVAVSQQPAASVPVSTQDWDSLNLRLYQMQAEIDAMRAERAGLAPPGHEAGYATESVEAPKPPAAKEDPIKALEKKWEEFQKAANNKPYPTVAINGVFQADAGWFSQDETSLETFGRIQDGADFRRAISAKGSVTENVNYFLQMDFGFFGRPTFTDVWVEMVEIPFLGAVRVGQWKQPFSLEVVSSFRYTTFMERSLLFQPFTPFRHIGIGFYNHADDLSATWALSAFRTGQDQFGNSISTDGGNGIAGRVTYLPWYDEPAEGRYYLHLGAGYFFNSPPRDVARFRSIPEFFIGEVRPLAEFGTSGQGVPGPQDGTPFFVDTRVIPNTTSVNTFGLETLWVHGPFSLQAEAMSALVNRADGDNLAYEGAYVQAGYFLTGEHRPYDRVAGAIDRIKPFENAFWVKTCDGSCHGSGAWEVAGRLSYIDLNDGNVRGGTLTDTTFGVNWYLNPYCKVVVNWVHAFLDRPRTGRSDTDMFGVRTQLDF